MDNIIEKMYELAGVKKNGGELTVPPTNDEPKFNEQLVCYGYPPFTDTKKLELTKWIRINKNEQYLYFFDVTYEYFRGRKFTTKEEKRKFLDSEYPQILANFVCELWDDLTPEQREEIRKVLR